jgi:hypothetical protein
MLARHRNVVAIVALCWLAAACGNGNDNNDNGSSGGNPTPTPTATALPQIPCPHEITYTVVGAGSDLDVGWTGLFHDQSTGSGASLSFSLTCPGSFLGQCGDCVLRGPGQSTTIVDNFRCGEDTHIRCKDAADQCPSLIGSRGCEFFFGAPLPIAGGGVPICVVNAIGATVHGTVSPEQGTGTSDIQIEFAIHTGIAESQPCPVCSGAALGDEGTCTGGPRDGQSCNVDGVNALYGNTSYDCPPAPGARVGASILPLDLTTGTRTITPLTTCGLSSATAPCYCTGQLQPNACVDGTCTITADATGGEGVCAAGPIDHVCRIDSFHSCLSKDDCPADGDECITRTRECLGDVNATTGVSLPIIRTGVPSQTAPLQVATFCVDATSSTAVNAAAGLPGPGALRLPTTTCVKDSCP